MGKIILIASGKGGSGTTTFAANLGVILANTGSGVCICDLNIGLRNDDIYLGMENNILFDLGDVISGICSVEKAVIPCDCCENLYLLPCPQCKEVSGLSSSHIASVLEQLKELYDYVLIDCPVTIGSLLDFAACKADKALLVVTPDYLCVRNTDAISQKLLNLGLDKRWFVINKIISMDSEPSLEWISNTMGIPLAGMLSYDDEIHISNNKGVPVAQSGSSYYVKTFIEIAARIVV